MSSVADHLSINLCGSLFLPTDTIIERESYLSFFFWCALVWFVLLALIYSRCLIWFCYKIRKVALDLQPLVFQLSRLKDLNGFDMTIKNHLITEPNYLHFRRLIIPTNEIQCWGTDMEFPPQKNSLMVSRTDHKTSWENFIAILKF